MTAPTSGSAGDGGRPCGVGHSSRAVTGTTRAGSARYWAAATRAHEDASGAQRMLEDLDAAEPGCPVVRADLAVLRGQPLPPIAGRGAGRPLRAWERHHLEVLALATTADDRRASALAAEHLAEVPEDGVVALVLARAARRSRPATVDGMDRTLRQRLEHLANELHLHRDKGDDAVDAAHAEVDAALQDEHHDDLRSRLERQAVELEAEHPQLATLIRGVIDSLTAAGL